MIYVLFVGNVLMGLSAILRYNHLPPQVPLFYSKVAGEDQLADTWLLALLPFLMNFLFILNLLIFKRFYKNNDLAKKIFSYLNIGIIASFTLIFIKIIFLVT